MKTFEDIHELVFGSWDNLPLVFGQVFLEQEDYGGQVDGEYFPVIAELLMEANEETCRWPL